MSNAKRAKGGSRQPRSGRRRRRRAGQSAAPSAHAQARALDQAPAVDLPEAAPAAPEIVSPADDLAAAAPASTGTPAAQELPALDDADQVSAAPQQDERLARRAVPESALAVPAPRAVRRTRTLADVARRARPAPTRPEEDAAADSNPRGDQPGETSSLPLQAAADESAERSGSIPDSPGEPPAPPESALEPPAAADLPLRTRPIPRTALLRDAQSERATPGGRDSKPLPAPSGREALSASGDAPTPLRFFKALQRGDARLVVRTALGHVFVGLAVAIAASGILLTGDELGYWLLGMAAITVCGGTAGYALLALRRTPTLGALALILAQLGALAVLFVAIGPQVAALLLVPAASYLAFRMGGRVVAFVSGIGAVAVYGGVVVAFASGLSAPPLVTLPGQAQVLFDGVAAAVGIGLLLVVLVTIVETRARSEAAARARLYELRLLRARMTGLRARAEEDGQVLETALTNALRGRGIESITADGALSPVAEAVNAVADRLETLQKDREDRLRLEGALRSAVRAVERGWLGLPWSWPEPSGTMLDELIVLLRTPRPQERSTPVVWPDETPTFVPRPKAGGGTEPLDPRTNPGVSRALPERSNAWYRR